MKTTVQLSRKGTIKNNKTYIWIIYGFSLFVVIFSIVVLSLAIQLHDWRETTATGDFFFGFHILTVVFLIVSIIWVSVSVVMKKGLKYTNRVNSLSNPLQEWKDKMNRGFARF